MNEENNTLVKQSNEVTTLLGFEYRSFEDMLPVLERLAKSKNIGANTADDVLAIIIQANELGIGFGTASNHMHVINGKSGMDIHIIKALLGKAGTSINWTLTKDYAPIYKYISPDGTVYTDYDIPEDAKVVHNKEQMVAAKEAGLYPVSLIKDKKTGRPIVYDYVTEYEFTREIKVLGNKIVTRKSTGRFSYLDAQTAGLGLNKQGEVDMYSPWYKYPKVMLATRAFTYGARDIASDLLLGCYETTELYDINNMEYRVNEQGTVIDVESIEVK